jgi:cell division protein FtsZ
MAEADSELKKILESRRAEIKVVGCGGAGGNTISRLMQVGIVGAETIAVNTDAQDLLYTDSDRKVLIGRELTGGLGAGADPHVGMEAAKESKDDIKAALEGDYEAAFAACLMDPLTAATLLLTIRTSSRAMETTIRTLYFSAILW